ncbi:MAG: sodium:alanine symporter family protein [Clostridia bacterium]|nr:sodium:alanine symporter family protein [Clostridia bacterium]
MAMLERITYWFYGAPLLILILAAGLYFTFKSRFFQFRKLWQIIKSPFIRDKDPTSGQMSAFQAMSMAIGGSVGVANISGVSTAIVTGGAGALFWMWVSAFLGMIIKMAEVTMACHYRRRDAEGKLWGGPTYYIEEFIGREKGSKLWKVLALLFGGGIFVSFFINVQNYAVAEAIGTTFDIPFMIPSVILGVVSLVLISGGLKRLGKIAEYLVPFMCVFYMGCVAIVLFICRARLSNAFELIISNAFSLKPAVGGVAGTCMAQSMKIGFARSLYSNEAGWGTSPMVHATVECSHPVKQGMLGAFEVFADTIMVCTATGLLVICTGMQDSGLMGAELTLTALEAYLGGGARIAVALSVFMFGLSSVVGWYAYYLTLINHGIKKKQLRQRVIKVFTLLMPIMGVALTLFAVTSSYSADKIWTIADFSAIFPTVINLIVLLLLGGKFAGLVKDFENRAKK